MDTHTLTTEHLAARLRARADSEDATATDSDPSPLSVECRVRAKVLREMATEMENEVAIRLPFSLREWYAGMALQGWAAGRNNGDELITTPNASKPEFVARSCFLYADAMIVAGKEQRDD